MFGISYGELFLLIGATAALVGPKDLPKIARTAGRLAGRSIGYVQLARGQFDNVMQQTQARQVHKELRETMAQLDAIRHEIRSVSILNPGPLTRRLMDGPPDLTSNVDIGVPEMREGPQLPTKLVVKDYSINTSSSSSTNIHGQATAYAKLVESGALESGTGVEKLDDGADPVTVLPISAESAGLLPKRNDSPRGSDLVLEAVIEAEVARNAKDFFSQPQNQIPRE